jgi:hypothetical protein
MCRGSFDEQNLESSESWLERITARLYRPEFWGKKMWKKGRGTTERLLGNSRAYILWIILLIEREGLCAQPSMLGSRSAMVVRPWRIRSSNWRSDLCQVKAQKECYEDFSGYTPFDIVDEQFRICAGRRGSCAVSSVPERRVRLRYVHRLRCGHAPVSIEMVAITIPSSVRSQPAPWHRRPCTGTLAETPACCSVARAPGIFPADEDRSRR